jgi:hypothetical protein
MIMRRQGLVWLAATVAALGAAACFSDPTKALRNGATRLQLSQYTVTLKAGDSLSVRAYALDDQGNQLDVGTPTWSSADPTVATARADAAAPGDVFANGVVVGINNQAGTTSVTVTVDGVQATIHVTVLPAIFPGTHTVTGTAVKDTFIVNPPGLPSVLTGYTTGDTLTLNATTTVKFSATSTNVAFGPFNGYVISRTANQIKVMSRQPFIGQPVVTNLVYSGDANTGPIAIATMPVDSIQLQHSRFHGVALVAGDTLTLTAAAGSTFSASTSIQFTGVTSSIFSRSASTLQAIAPILTNPTYTGGFTVYGQLAGAATIDSAHSTLNVTMNRATWSGTATVSPDTLIVTPPAVGNFNIDTTGGKQVSGLKLAGNAGIVFVNDTVGRQMKSLSGANYTGIVTVLNVRIGSVMVDSLKTTGSVTIAKAVFPGAVSNGSGHLLDTVVVASTAAAKFKASGAAAGQSNITLGGQRALVISRTTDTMKVISVVGSSGVLTVSNVVVGASLIPSLSTVGAVAVSTAVTGEANEPGNNSETTPDTLKFTGAADTITVYGSVDCEDNGTACPGNGDFVDYYYLNLLTTNSLKAIIDWYGTGTGGTGAQYGIDHTNPDLDVLICKTTGGTCAYDGSEIDGFSGATNIQPQIAITSAALAPQGVFIAVWPFSTPSPIAYRLRVLRF